MLLLLLLAGTCHSHGGIAKSDIRSQQKAVDGTRLNIIILNFVSDINAARAAAAAAVDVAVAVKAEAGVVVKPSPTPQENHAETSK